MCWFKMSNQPTKVTVDISKDSNLYFLLNAAIGAYNRRTDVMARALTEQQKVDQLAAEIQRVSEDLTKAVQPKTKE